MKETHELFGSGGLIWEESYRLFQIGYNIKKSHWNHGYTTEAMSAILKFEYTDLSIKRIAGGHAKENLASEKVLKKLGLFKTGMILRLISTALGISIAGRIFWIWMHCISVLSNRTYHSIRSFVPLSPCCHRFILQEMVLMYCRSKI